MATGDSTSPDLSATAVPDSKGAPHGYLRAETSPIDDAAPEQLDWGSIHDEDGAFGQIGAAIGELEEGELDLEDRAEAEKGNGSGGAAAAILLTLSGSAPGNIEDGALDLGDRVDAEGGNAALSGSARQVMGSRAELGGSLAAEVVDPASSGCQNSRTARATSNGAINSGAGFTTAAEMPGFWAADITSDAFAPKGKLEDGGAAQPGVAQAGGAGTSEFEADGSCY